MSIFSVTYCDDIRYAQFGVAYGPPDEEDFWAPEVGEKVNDWKCLKLKMSEGEFADYLANDLGLRLCSERLKRVLVPFCKENQHVIWLPVEVVNARGQLQCYYALHFLKGLKALDSQKSVLVDDLVVKPVFRSEFDLDSMIFGLPKQGGTLWFVSADVKIQIEAEGITGLAFSKEKVTKK